MTPEGGSTMQPEESIVRRADVEASIREGRHPGHDPARWALPLIAEADTTAGGRWRRVALTADVSWRLWLPPHAGEPCHGDTLALAGGTGAHLDVAVDWLLRHQARYATANPTCWARIDAARRGAIGPLVLATFPVGDRTGPPAGAVRPSFIVVDGLHRALAWGLTARSPADPTVDGPPPAPPTPLEAFIAGA